MLSPDLIRVETVIEYDFHQINLIVLCAIKKKDNTHIHKENSQKKFGVFFLIFFCVAPLFILPFFK